MKIKEFGSIFFAFYILFSLSLTLLSNSFSFLIGFGFYYSFIVLISIFFIKKDHKRNFVKIVNFFFIIYTTYATISHFIFIDNPLKNYFVDIDETKFFEESLLLSEYSYSALWHTTFSEFQYSGSPFFYALIGTLQKLTDLNLFYSLLFQKINVVFYGSFVPGIVYLLGCRLMERKTSIKGAIAYGILSFTFFYSVGFMRDIHIALIFALALYIITGNNYDLKNYLTLAILGLIAYFIRVENGLFFVVFLGVWMVSSNTRYKIPIYVVSLIMLAAGVYAIGGINLILNTAINTSENYTERAITLSDQASLGVVLNKLPVPLNYISKTAFGQIVPFPFWVPLSEGNSLIQKLFYLPQAIAGLFWFLIWTRILLNFNKARQFFRENKWVLLLALFYIVTVSAGQANPRRLMAVYPVIFMGYLFVDNKVFRWKEIFTASLMYMVLLLVYALLKI